MTGKPIVYLYHTDDDGATWRMTSTTGQMRLTKELLMPMVRMLNPTVGWALSTSKDVTSLFGTSDGGATWKLLTAQADNIYQGLDFVDTSRGWSIDNAGKLWATDNGGSTWTVIDAHLPG